MLGSSSFQTSPDVPHLSSIQSTSDSRLRLSLGRMASSAIGSSVFLDSTILLLSLRLTCKFCAVPTLLFLLISYLVPTVPKQTNPLVPPVIKCRIMSPCPYLHLVAPHLQVNHRYRSHSGLTPTFLLGAASVPRDESVVRQPASSLTDLRTVAVGDRPLQLRPVKTGQPFLICHRNNPIRPHLTKHPHSNRSRTISLDQPSSPTTRTQTHAAFPTTLPFNNFSNVSLHHRWFPTLPLHRMASRQSAVLARSLVVLLRLTLA